MEAYRGQSSTPIPLTQEKYIAPASIRETRSSLVAEQLTKFSFSTLLSLFDPCQVFGFTSFPRENPYRGVSLGNVIALSFCLVPLWHPVAHSLGPLASCSTPHDELRKCHCGRAGSFAFSFALASPHCMSVFACFTLFFFFPANTFLGYLIGLFKSYLYASMGDESLLLQVAPEAIVLSHLFR